MNKRIIYVPLESYVARYTYQLRKWNEDEFKRLNVPYIVIEGKTLSDDGVITTGQVLDAHNRTYYALSQVMNIVSMLKNNEIKNSDVIFFEDMFHPGIESLPYIFNQSDIKPDIYVRCLAQTIDPDDFVNKTDIYKWMRHFEKMTAEFVSGVICASEEMLPNIMTTGWNCDLFVTGLPFGKDEVRSRVSSIKPFHERSDRVVFAARWDIEKQPGFFMDLVESVHNECREIEFAVLSGGKLRSNDASLLDRLKRSNIKVYENLSKNEYYELLNDSKVLFNCALQDWVSNTVSEADTLGCNVLYPAYRSFPEVFANDHERLYVPWSLTDAKNKLYKLLNAPHENMGKISDYQNSTIQRTVDILLDREVDLWRSNRNYRHYLLPQKYENNI